MTEDNGAVRLQRQSAEEIEATVESITRMLKVGAVFAGVGYLLVGSAIVFELTEFHPLLDDFFRTYTETSLAGGSGGPRGGAVNEALASIHKWPSTLLWLKLGGIGHILLGIFIALAAIVRALALMPHRLAYEMGRSQS
ncbi:hypothetical protein [Halapricum hydrolyticum]|uniref:Uncharacterized protein n=1 Tax=Halapricum hydrolyticum TaxID=2979991 RepID=A0AAE3I8N4_9EURY|nr:hypothetical protein [Halapricum hydrolyticum]MCU4717027.1 hypothetical protein [Halapricum hydrolyticum]MCU4725367.1 hypothetical protein [Halapricum hydrolyticum]